MEQGTLQSLKRILREEDIPFFSDEDIQSYYIESNGDFNKTVYTLAIIKSEDTTIQISGLSMGDTSKYFLRVAQRYRPHNSGILKGF